MTKRIIIKSSIALFLAIFFSQIPAYWASYQQALHAEYNHVIEQLDDVDGLAAKDNLNRYDFIMGLLQSSQVHEKIQGESYLQLLSKLQWFKNTLLVVDKSQGADAWLLLIIYFDWDIFLNSFLTYMPWFELSIVYFGYFFFGLTLAIFAPYIPGCFKTRYVRMSSEERLDTVDEESQIQEYLESQEAEQPSKLRPE